MKKITALVLSAVLLMGLFTGVSATEARDFTVAQNHAKALQALGLFKGTENGFALENALTRSEAITMLVRILGKEEEAEDYGKTHPFSDVAPWADGYVSYAYDAGLTNGISDTLFGAEIPVESNMYLTFILRAMGYMDADNQDFIWQMPYALAAELEMLPPEIELINFRRGDAVTFTAAALFAPCKDTDTALYEKLTKEGVFTEEDWNSAFPEDPFIVYRAQNRAVSETVRAESGEQRPNQYKFYNYMLLDVSEKEDSAEALVVIHLAHYTVTEENTIVGTGSGGRVRCLFLEKDTWTVLGEDEERGYSLSEHFPESALGMNDKNIWQGMNIRLGIEVAKTIASGALTYKVPSYEQSLARYTEDSIYSIEERMETEQCTILAGHLAGVPHGPAGFVCLIYKPGSIMGEGKAISLPLPEISAWGARKLPEDLTLSADGKTITYSFYFDSEMKLEMDGEVKRVVHEAGTYTYETDILTGETKLEILKEK